MTLVSNSTVRRFRVLHVQMVLACVAFLAFLAVTSIYRKATIARDIAEIRKEELKKYGLPEVDLHYVRRVGLTYRKISSLTEDQIENMNDTELLVSINSFLDNADIICKRKLRMGFVSDGGWEICDDLPARPSVSSCLIYSFSVGLQYDFPDDVSRVYGCEVHSFNPNLGGQDFNRSSLVRVHPYGIGRESYVAADGREYYTLPDIRSIVGHHLDRKMDVVHMTLEGAEWPVLYNTENLNELRDVKQLLIDFHIGFPPLAVRHRRMLRVLRSLSELGFRKFYVRKRARGAYHHPGFPVMQAKHYEVHFINTHIIKAPDNNE